MNKITPIKKSSFRLGRYSITFFILWLFAISFNAVVWYEYKYEVYELTVRAYPNLFIFPFLLILSLINLRPALRFLKNYSSKKLTQRSPHIEKYIWVFILTMSLLITCAETMNSGAVWMINKNDVSEAKAFSKKTHIDFLSSIVDQNVSEQKINSNLFSCSKASGKWECLAAGTQNELSVSTRSGKCFIRGSDGKIIEYSNLSPEDDLTIGSLNDRKKLAHCRLVYDSNETKKTWVRYYYYFSFFCFVFILGTILTISTITGIASWKVKPEIYPSEKKFGLTSNGKLLYINGCSILSVVILIFWIIMSIVCTDGFSLIYPNGTSIVINRFFIFQYFLVIVILLLGLFKSEQVLQKIILGLVGLAASFYAVVYSEKIAYVFKTLFVTNFSFLSLLIFTIFLGLLSVIPAVILFFWSIPSEAEP